MDELREAAGEHKPKIDASDAAALVHAKAAKSPVRLNQLLKFHQSRGVLLREILAAMARSPVVGDPIGAGRPRAAPASSGERRG